MVSTNVHFLVFDSSHNGNWQRMATRDYANSVGGGSGGGWGTSGTIATLTGDGTVELDGHELEFNLNGGLFNIEQDGDYFITIDPTQGFTKVQGIKVNSPGVFNAGQGYYTASETNAQVTIEALYNTEEQVAALVLSSDSGGSSFSMGISGQATYTAATHTFNGVLINPTQFTPANSTDNTYTNGAFTFDDSFLYYRTSDGTWKKIAWGAF